MQSDSVSFLPDTLDDERRRFLLNELLRDVSRSFYLTLRVLPQPQREPISVAYLLARAADTISDSAVVPAAQRAAALQRFREQLSGEVSRTALEQLKVTFSGRLDHAAEKRLLMNLLPLFELLQRQPLSDRLAIRKVVTTLTEGMVEDLNTFPAEHDGAEKPVALKQEEKLDRYTYLVAGCVGEFWTELSVAHCDLLRDWDADTQTTHGIRFGKALQLVNILRDVPRDLRLGRCYLPQVWLDPHGLNAEQLLDSKSSEAARPVLNRGIAQALDHFDAGEQYLYAIPRRAVRLRLAALWPMLIGLETLARLSRQAQWLAPEQVCKVERRWVYRMLLFSCAAVFSNSIIHWWCRSLRRAIDSA